MRVQSLFLHPRLHQIMHLLSLLLLVAALAAASALSNFSVVLVGGKIPSVPTPKATATLVDSTLATQIALLTAQVNAMSKAKEIKDSADLSE